MPPITPSSAHRLGAYPLRKAVSPQPVQAAPPSKPEIASPKGTVTVAEGDSLARIAQHHLGDANRWREIFELNRNQIQDPNLIFPGMLLKLPGQEASKPESKPVEKAPPPSGQGAKIVDGARTLHERGYRYPPDLTDRYYHEPGKVGCCADFACDSYREAGFDLGAEMRAKGYNTAWCPDMLEYFRKHQQAIPAEGKAQVGDTIFFDWGKDGDGPDHVGVVSKVDDLGRPIEVIESRSFDSPTEITTLCWDPPDGRASCVEGYGRLK